MKTNRKANLHIGQYFPYDLTKIGGVETHIYQLSLHLIEQGINVSVISPNTQSLEKIPLVKYTSSNIIKGFDIIHTHGSQIRGFGKLDFKGKHVHTFHGCSLRRMLVVGELTKNIYRTFRHGESGFLASYRELRMGRKADTCISVSHATTKDINTFFRIPLSKINMIPSSHFPHSEIDFDKGLLKIKLGIPKNDKVILYVGRDQDPVKGAQIFLNALNLLDLSDITVIMIPGDTPTYTNKIIRTGPLFHEAISDYYRIADIYVSSSLYEGGRSLSVQEAMSFGCATIVSDTPSMTEFLQNGKTTMIFKVGSHIELAAHLNTLIANEELRTRLGHNAKTYIMKHTWKNVAIKTKKLYSKILL